MSDKDKPATDPVASPEKADTAQDAIQSDSQPLVTEPATETASAENTDVAKDEHEADPGDKSAAHAEAEAKHPHTAHKKVKKKKTKSAARQSTDTKTEHPSELPSEKSGLPWVAMLALVLSGVVGYGAYYNHQQLLLAIQADQSQTGNHEMLSGQVSDLRQELRAAQSGDRQLIDGLKASAQEQQVVQLTIKKSIDQLSTQLAKKGRGPMQWRIAEVDYLLSVANHSVILERNVKTAARALADADERLEAISDPALIPVRRKIAGEINALKSVDLPDIAGMSVTLKGLVEGIEHLPLISKERVFDRVAPKEDGPIQDWRDLPSAMWEDIKSLVTVRRNIQPVERLLPPEEKHYLYQNLGLKLEEARIALLQRETDTFQRHLNDTGEWVKRYFDPESAAVTTVISTIDTLVTAELKPPLPDISGSLRDLRQWNSAKQNARLMQPDRRTVAATSQKHRQKPALNTDESVARLTGATPQ